MKKRILSAILAGLMLLPTLASCSDTTSDENETKPASNGDNPSTTDTTAEGEEESVSEIDARRAISDDLPDVKYGGRSFRVLTTQGGAIYGFDYSSEIISEEMNGDKLNDVVYDRNVGIEERFDVVITCDTNTMPYSYIGTMATSGSDDFDIVGMYNFEAYQAINARATLNWYDVPYVNLDKPWHNQLANDAATMNGILYAICSDLAITSMLYTHAFFFNSKLTERYGYTADDIYTLVQEGNWTLDKAIEITSGMYEDVDGNGERDENDIYGFAYSIWNAADVWLAAFDQSICETSDSGIELTFMTDKTVSIVEKLCDWHYNSGIFYNYPAIYEEEVQMANGRLVFAPIRFKACFDALRTMEDPYCIIPYPKWDTAQEKYLTNADDKFTVFCVPTTAYQNLEFIGTIYEALCAESYKEVYPTFYNEALKGKYSSDPTTAQMIDLIMEGRNFDFSFQFANGCFQGLPYWVREALQKNDTNISSRYAGVKKSLGKNIPKAMNPLYDLDA